MKNWLRGFDFHTFLGYLGVALIYPVYAWITSEQKMLKCMDAMTIVGLVFLILGVIRSLVRHGDFDISEYVPETGLEGMMKVVWRALDLYSINSTRESRKLADYCVHIKNSNTAIFSMENFDQTIREGYDCVMACKDDLLRIFD